MAGSPQWVPPLLYAVVLALAVTPKLAALMMALAGSMAAVLVVWKTSVNRIFLVVLAMSVFKIAYYFALNDFPSSDLVDFLDAEGRMFVTLAILLVVASQSYSADQLQSAVTWMIRLYLLWVPLLFAIRLLGIGEDDPSHHQLGVSALSGFALLLITRRRRNISLNLLLLVLAFATTVVSGSRTAVLSAVLMIAYMLWTRLRLVGRGAVLTVFVTAIVLVAGTKVEIGKRQYDFGAYKYVGRAIAYGMEHPQLFAEAAEGRRDVQVVGGDANIIGRGVVWGKAIAHFIDSPLVGMGPGRFDDGGTCSHRSVLFCVHDQGASSYAGGTAHNAVLHVLAEEGLVGLALSLWFVIAVILSIRSKQSEIDALHWDRSAITAYWLALLFAAMFQHVLASPLYATAFFMPLVSIACLRSMSIAPSGVPVLGSRRSNLPTSHCRPSV